jgi:hypothetical protein
MFVSTVVIAMINYFEKSVKQCEKYASFYPCVQDDIINSGFEDQSFIIE